jgi:small subunit ribosomal protein S16
MSVVIRMRRTGRKNRPCYRINVADSRFPRDGRLLETIGLYDPIRKDEAAQVQIDVERARHWIAKGARVTETVASLFKKHGVTEPKPKPRRERPGRKKATATRARRETSKAQRLERKKARLTDRRAKRKAAAAAAPAAT